MSDAIISLLTGGVGAAIVASIHAVHMYKLKRKDEQADKDDVIKKALRYVMLYIIQERCKEHIAAGKITVDARRALHKWHDLYHTGLAGNGDADGLMQQVDELEIEC